jgi:hypothetical protein
MVNVKYGEMPSFDDFVDQLKTYVDEDGEMVASEPPEVFWMEIPVDSSDYTAFVSLYESLNSSIQEQIIINDSEVEHNCVAIIFTTYKSLYEFLSVASQQWNYPDCMELAAAIMDTFGYNWR